MTATVIALPSFRRIVIPELNREERLEHLWRLAEQVTLETTPEDFTLRLLVAALSHESLRGLASMRAWTAFIREQNNYLDCLADDTNSRDMDPGQAKADRDDALRFLLDGAS